MAEGPWKTLLVTLGREQKTNRAAATDWSKVPFCPSDTDCVSFKIRR